MKKLTLAVFAFAMLGLLKDAHAQLPFEPSPNFNYLIIEGTKGERFAAGADDNVLRWASTGGMEQRWRFVKSDKYPNRYKIQSRKYENETKLLDVQWHTGNVSIHSDNGKEEQTFTFLKLLDPIAEMIVPDLYKEYKKLGVDFVWITEWSRGGKERVAIGSNGRALRWGSNMEKSQVFILRPEVAGADVVHSSYDRAVYRYDSNATGSNKFVWNGGWPTFTHTIYNPLDGGVLLTYKQTDWPSNSDGCSAGGEPGQTVFREACFAHDANYGAPFDKAGFPSYKSGASTGQELADYIFLKDMLQIAKQRTPGLQNLWETTAYAFYRAVSDFGKYRGGTDKQEVLDKGGAIAVKNKGHYPMVLRVEWTAPQGSERVEEIVNAGGSRAAVIPLSVGTKNIKVKCWEGGQEIFTKTFPEVGMYAFTVRGATLTPQYVDGLED